MTHDTITIRQHVRRLRNTASELHLVATRLDRGTVGLSEAAVQRLDDLDRARRALLEALTTQGTTPAGQKLLEEFGRPARTQAQNMADDRTIPGGKQP